MCGYRIRNLVMWFRTRFQAKPASPSLIFRSFEVVSARANTLQNISLLMGCLVGVGCGRAADCGRIFDGSAPKPHHAACWWEERDDCRSVTYSRKHIPTFLPILNHPPALGRASLRQPTLTRLFSSTPSAASNLQYRSSCCL